MARRKSPPADRPGRSRRGRASFPARPLSSLHPSKEIPMTRVLGVGALALISAIVLAACGGTSSSGGGSGYGSSPMAPAAPAGGGAAAQVVKVGQSSLGKFLVNGNGRTLYVFKADHGSRSA